MGPLKWWRGTTKVVVCDHYYDYHYHDYYYHYHYYHYNCYYYY